MSFSLRAAIANIGFVALFLGGCVTASGWYIAVATVLFLLLILLSVANAILDTGHRPFWVGSAVVACGVLLFSNHLPIFDAIAQIEDQRRTAMMPPPRAMLPTSYVPVTAGSPNAVYPPYSPGISSTSTTPIYVNVVSPQPPLPSFAPVTDADGYTNLLRAFLVCSASYFLGLVGGLICSKLYALNRGQEGQS